MEAQKYNEGKSFGDWTLPMDIPELIGQVISKVEHSWQGHCFIYMFASGDKLEVYAETDSDGCVEHFMYFNGKIIE
jgi:hypothetical protein